MKKILILYAPVGMGHPMVARAVEEVFNRKYKNIFVQNLSILEFMSPAFKTALPNIYNQISSKIPILYKLAYQFYNKPSRQRILNYGSKFFLKIKFVSFLKDFAPDFILSSHPLSMQLISMTKEQKLIDILSANICTDYGCHSYWINSYINYYFVATEEVKDYLISYGVKKNQVIISGIPVGLKFIKEINRQAILDRLNLSEDKPVLLIIGGQFSYSKLKKIIYRIKQRDNQIQFIIVGGRDRELNKDLENSELKKEMGVKIFGFVKNMEELMTASDLIFSKAGGATVAECLAKNLPMIIHKVIPGQEEDNVNYLVRNNAAISVEKVEDISEGILNLFSNQSRLMAMKKSCKKLSKPNAALDIADYVVSKI